MVVLHNEDKGAVHVSLSDRELDGILRKQAALKLYPTRLIAVIMADIPHAVVEEARLRLRGAVNIELSIIELKPDFIKEIRKAECAYNAVIDGFRVQLAHEKWFTMKKKETRT